MPSALPSWLLRETQRDTHSHVSVFVGPDADHRALAGTLILSLAQAEDLFGMMGRAGEVGPKRQRVEVHRLG